MSANTATKPITTSVLRGLKAVGEKFSVLTAYDHSMARALDEAGIDVLLVGDSAANVFAGYDTTLPITLDQMIYHASAVVRGSKRALVMVDLPFGSYQGAAEDAFRAAVRVMKETGAQAVKLEGGVAILENVRKIVDAGIPVCGHLGLTPQSINTFGTFGVRAREEAEAQKLKADALALQEAGCFAIVLEKIPAGLAKEVTDMLDIPTIGIGAGSDCDAQVLVVNDMLGLTKGFKPKFLRRYMDLYGDVVAAARQYDADVKSGRYPSGDEQY